MKNLCIRRTVPTAVVLGTVLLSLLCGRPSNGPRDVHVVNHHGTVTMGSAPWQKGLCMGPGITASFSLLGSLPVSATERYPGPETLHLPVSLRIPKWVGRVSVSSSQDRGESHGPVGDRWGHSVGDSRQMGFRCGTWALSGRDVPGIQDSNVASGNSNAV